MLVLQEGGILEKTYKNPWSKSIICQNYLNEIKVILKIGFLRKATATIMFYFPLRCFKFIILTPVSTAYLIIEDQDQLALKHGLYDISQGTPMVGHNEICLLRLKNHKSSSSFDGCSRYYV